MTVLRFYVAGPYTENPETCTAEAIRVGNLILDLGHAPFVPHLSHYWHTLHGQRHGFRGRGDGRIGRVSTL